MFTYRASAYLIGWQADPLQHLPGASWILIQYQADIPSVQPAVSIYINYEYMQPFS